jgi:unsaturated rhamnogalacturonyl hydrolase
MGRIREGEMGVQTSGATSGHSPNFWARAMGWYGMALVDALDYFPAHYAGRDTLLAILQRYAAAIRNVQDPATGLWWDILDRPGQAGNYPEASASAMFVYTLARGVREGYLPASYRGLAEKGYRGLVGKYISTGPDSVTVCRGRSVSAVSAGILTGTAAMLIIPAKR